MGTPASEPGRLEWEDTQSGAGGGLLPVTISQGFWIAETEVTQEQWTAVTGGTLQSQMKLVAAQSDWGIGLKLPMYYVSAEDIEGSPTAPGGFLAAFAGKAGVSARLPKEAGWEYACRAGTRTAFSFGDDPEELPKYGSFRANTDAAVLPVATRDPNPWGLLDVHGSVWEICADTHPEFRVETEPSDAPALRQRVARGGGCNSDAAGCRSGSRQSFATQARDFNLGFPHRAAGRVVSWREKRRWESTWSAVVLTANAWPTEERGRARERRQAK